MEQAPPPNTAMTLAQPATGKERRFPPLTIDQLDDKQKPLGEQIVKVSSIGIAGPYNRCCAAPCSVNACSTCFIICAGKPRCRSGSMNSRS